MRLASSVDRLIAVALAGALVGVLFTPPPVEMVAGLALFILPGVALERASFVRQNADRSERVVTVLALSIGATILGMLLLVGLNMEVTRNTSAGVLSLIILSALCVRMARGRSNAVTAVLNASGPPG